MPEPVPAALPPREAIDQVADVLRRVLAIATPADGVAPELLTRAQVARLLGISLSAFSDLESRGFIGPESIRLGDGGRIIRYSRNEIVNGWIPAGAPTRARWQAMRNARRAG